MKSQRPYLLRALYDWIVDSEEVPYILVDATVPGVEVPNEHVKDGQIVLNIGPNAVRDLQLGDEWVMFSSRFNGRVFEVQLPMSGIKAIYARGTGDGLAFPEEKARTSSTDELGPSHVLSPSADELTNDQVGQDDRVDRSGAKKSGEQNSGNEPPGDDDDPEPPKPKLRLV